MKGRLSNIEARVEALVEGTFARLFAGRLYPRDVALQLARALEDSASFGGAATRYAVHLHPDDADALVKAHPDLAETLAAELLNLARQAQVTLPERPMIILVANPARRPRTVLVVAEKQSDAASATQGMSAVPAGTLPPAPQAFVILDGERTVVLSQAIVTLGRRADNDIVVDDPRVSRAHAQLRLRFGRYVVYDLGSRGGTFVNGQRIEECVLRPGDVISLGGIPIIYGEDAPPAEPPAGADERATIPLRPPTPPSNGAGGSGAPEA